MKNTVMTREELDERILNRVPHSGTHHYDGIYFAIGILAERRRKKSEREEKLKILSAQKQVEKVISSKQVKELGTIEI